MFSSVFKKPSSSKQFEKPILKIPSTKSQEELNMVDLLEKTLKNNYKWVDELLEEIEKNSNLDTLCLQLVSFSFAQENFEFVKAAHEFDKKPSEQLWSEIYTRFIKRDLSENFENTFGDEKVTKPIELNISDNVRQFLDELYKKSYDEKFIKLYLKRAQAEILTPLHDSLIKQVEDEKKTSLSRTVSCYIRR